MQTFCIPLGRYSRATRPEPRTRRFELINTQNGALRANPRPSQLRCSSKEGIREKSCLGNKICESVTASLSSTMQLQRTVKLIVSQIRLKPKTNLIKPSLSNTPNHPTPVPYSLPH
jgi:hypothetical protein